MTPNQKIEQAKLIKMGSGWDCYWFASRTEGADIRALQARVIEVGDRVDIRCFGRDIEGADIQLLQCRLDVLSRHAGY